MVVAVAGSPRVELGGDGGPDLGGGAARVACGGTHVVAGGLRRRGGLGLVQDFQHQTVTVCGSTGPSCV